MTQLRIENEPHQNHSDFETETQKELAKKKLGQYVLDNWINQYFEMKLRADILEMPSLIASYSDMPSNAANGPHSSTESSVIKKMNAEEWIAFFHSKVEQLPKLHQDLIRKKYLQPNHDGKWQSDCHVYDELHISRTQFYTRKKEALYWLGLLFKYSKEGDF